MRTFRPYFLRVFGGYVLTRRLQVRGNVRGIGYDEGKETGLRTVIVLAYLKR